MNNKNSTIPVNYTFGGTYIGAFYDINNLTSSNFLGENQNHYR